MNGNRSRPAAGNVPAGPGGKEHDARSDLPTSFVGHALRLAAAGAVRIYQLVVSPWLPPSCRFSPTCSEYARQALIRHGILRGTWMSLRRLSRCHPFCSGGYDPVP